MNSKSNGTMIGESAVRNTRGDLGGAAVECSMLVLMLVSIVGGIIDFGLKLALTHQVQHAAREGARFAAELPTLITPKDPRVEDYVTRLLPSQSALFDMPDVGNSSLEDNGLRNTAGNACDLEVTVTVRQKYAYSFLSMLGIGNADVTRRVRMRSHNQDLC